MGLGVRACGRLAPQVHGEWGEAGPRAPLAVDAGERSQPAVKPPRSGRKHRRPNGYGYMHGTDVLNVSTELADAAWVSVQTTGTVGRGCRPDRSGRASNAGEIGPAGATERQAGVASGFVG